MWLFTVNPLRRVFITCLCLCIALLTAHVSLAATIIVDGTNCTLSQAITAANTPTSCGSYAGSTGHDIISLEFSSLTLSSALPAITSDITIRGNGKTIDGGGSYRIFNVTSGHLKIDNITLTNGSAGQGSGGDGGAISVAFGAQLTATNCNFNNNTGQNGGAIHVVGRLTISNCSILNNTATRASGGGGIFVAFGGRAFIRHVTIYGNTLSESNAKGTALAVDHATAWVVLENSILGDTDGSTNDCGLYRNASLKQNIGNVIENGEGNCNTDNITGLDIGVTTTGFGNPQVYPINATSSANGRGDASICKQYPRDQVGIYRPATGCDAGASERGGTNYIDVDATCSLSEAIGNANDNGATNTDCEGGVTDAVATDTIRMTVDEELTAGTASVTSTIVVEGQGKTVSVASGSTARPFHVGTGGDLTLRNITISGGRDTQGSTVHSRGTLTMEDCTVTGSTATTDDAGAVIIWDNSTATITRCTFSSNTAGKEGGAINVASGTMTITDSVFRGNTAGYEGGAINLETGTLTVTGSAFIENRAESSSYTDNYGGAIYAYSGTLTVGNSTFIGNYGQIGAGGIYVLGDTATLTHLTLSNNIASTGLVSGISGGGTTNIVNSVIAQSSAQSAPLCGGSFSNSATERGILTWNGPATDNCGTVTVGNPQLGSQTGSIPYLPLGAGSAAIGKGIAAGCAGYATDQAGNARPGTNCDSGAVQYIAGDVVLKTSSGGTYISPTPVPCSGEWLNANTSIQVSATYDICSGIQFQRRDASAVGIGWVVEVGFVDAVDVWGWVRPTATVCFPQAGSTLFINASTTPHTVEQLPSWLEGNSTCASVGVHGLIVLLPMDSPHTTSPSAGAQSTQSTLSDCMVTTQARLNLRLRPNGTVIGVVPNNATLTTFASKDGWYNVDYYGTRGWIGGDYATPAGNCG